MSERDINWMHRTEPNCQPCQRWAGMAGAWRVESQLRGPCSHGDRWGQGQGGLSHLLGRWLLWLEKFLLPHSFCLLWVSAAVLSVIISIIAMVAALCKHRDKEEINTTWYHLYVESKKWHKWTYLRNRNRLTDFENNLWLPKLKRGGEG